MADNFNATAGDGSVVGAADDIGGVKYPRVKIIIGADGTNDGDVAAGNPMPITGTVTTSSATSGTIGATAPTKATQMGFTDGSGNLATPVTSSIGMPVSILGTVTVASHAVTNAGTFAVQATVAAGATTIGKAEDAASANADVGVPAMAIQLATPTDLAGTDADYAMLQMSGGRLWASTVVTGSVAVTNAGTFAVQATVAAGATNIAKAEDVASADADVGVPAMAIRKATPANTSGTDGDYEMLQMSAGRLWARAQVEGATASDAALANPPATVGGRATNTNLAEMSADGDVVDAQFTMQGALVTAHAPRELLAPQQTQISNSTSETTIVTAGASGIFNDLYGVILANTGSSGTKVTIKDATAGTTRAIVYVPATETRGFMLPAGSAVPQASAANNWTATCGTATTALEVTAFYVKRK